MKGPLTYDQLRSRLERAEARLNCIDRANRARQKAYRGRLKAKRAAEEVLIVEVEPPTETGRVEVAPPEAEGAPA